MSSLNELGLSDYEASVYRTLLSSGPAAAKAVSEASGVPMGRIYDVLNDLETAGMVRSQQLGHSKRYTAVEPEHALNRQLESKREELEAELDRYEAVVDDLVERLEASNPNEQFWTVAIGPDDSVELLEERLATATERIVVVANVPPGDVDPVESGDRLTAEMGAALDRGVDVSLLVAPDLLEILPDDVQVDYRKQLREHPNFEIRVAENIAGSFTLIDRAEICLEVPNPLAPGEMFALVDLTDPSFATEAYKQFRTRWEQAEPAPRP